MNPNEIHGWCVAIVIFVGVAMYLGGMFAGWKILKKESNRCSRACPYCDDPVYEPSQHESGSGW